jgi:hypothetical protein
MRAIQERQDDAAFGGGGKIGRAVGEREWLCQLS